MVVSVWTHEQLADLESVQRAPAALRITAVYGEIEALLEPVSDSIGPLHSTIVGVIGNNSPREFSDFSAFRSEIIVDNYVEYPGWFDFGVINLDFVGLCKRAEGKQKHENKYEQRGGK